MINKHL